MRKFDFPLNQIEPLLIKWMCRMVTLIVADYLGFLTK